MLTQSKVNQEDLWIGRTRVCAYDEVPRRDIFVEDSSVHGLPDSVDDSVANLLPVLAIDVDIEISAADSMASYVLHKKPGALNGGRARFGG